MQKVLGVTRSTRNAMRNNTRDFFSARMTHSEVAGAAGAGPRPAGERAASAAFLRGPPRRAEG